MTEEMLEEAKLERKRKAARESVKRYRDKKRHQASIETDVEWRTVTVDEQKNNGETAPAENQKDEVKDEVDHSDKMSEDEDGEEEEEEQDDEEEDEEAEAEEPQSSKSSEKEDSAAKGKVKEVVNIPEETNGATGSSLRRSARTRTAVWEVLS